MVHGAQLLLELLEDTGIIHMARAVGPLEHPSGFQRKALAAMQCVPERGAREGMRLSCFGDSRMLEISGAWEICLEEQETASEARQTRHASSDWQGHSGGDSYLTTTCPGR